MRFSSIEWTFSLTGLTRRNLAYSCSRRDPRRVQRFGSLVDATGLPWVIPRCFRCVCGFLSVVSGQAIGSVRMECNLKSKCTRVGFHVRVVFLRARGYQLLKMTRGAVRLRFACLFGLGGEGRAPERGVPVSQRYRPRRRGCVIQGADHALEVSFDRARCGGKGPGANKGVRGVLRAVFIGAGGGGVQAGTGEGNFPDT